MKNKNFRFPDIPSFEPQPLDLEIPEDAVFPDAEMLDMFREHERKNEIDNKRNRRDSNIALAVAVLSLLVAVLSLAVAVFELKLSFFL